MTETLTTFHGERLSKQNSIDMSWVSYHVIRFLLPKIGLKFAVCFWHIGWYWLTLKRVNFFHWCSSVNQ